MQLKAHRVQGWAVARLTRGNLFAVPGGGRPTPSGRFQKNCVREDCCAFSDPVGPLEAVAENGDADDSADLGAQLPQDHPADVDFPAHLRAAGSTLAPHCSPFCPMSILSMEKFGRGRTWGKQRITPGLYPLYHAFHASPAHRKLPKSTPYPDRPCPSARCPPPTASGRGPTPRSACS